MKSIIEKIEAKENLSPEEIKEFVQKYKIEEDWRHNPFDDVWDPTIRPLYMFTLCECNGKKYLVFWQRGKYDNTMYFKEQPKEVILKKKEVYTTITSVYKFVENDKEAHSFTKDLEEIKFY